MEDEHVKAEYKVSKSLYKKVQDLILNSNEMNLDD